MTTPEQRRVNTARKAAWRAAHPEAQVMTPEKRRANARAQARFRAAHPERVETARREYMAQPANKAHYAKLARERRRRYSPEKRREASLVRLYGLTLVEYAAILTKQEGRCANPGCRADESRGRTTQFHVDHDHATGTVRGLLCNRCNVALGMVRDDQEKLLGLVAYLRQHGDVRDAGQPALH